MEPSICFRLDAVDGKGLLGQRRHDQRIGKQPAYVDAERDHLNQAIYRAEGWDRVPGSSVKEDTERAHNLMEQSRREIEARAKRKTKVAKYWRTAIITFSHDAQKVLAEKETTPHEEALTAFKEFADAHGVKLLSVDFHGDESAPHFHAMFEGVTEKGYALRLDKAALSQEQDHVARHFADLGLTRGKKKIDRIADGEDPSKWNHRTVRELHEQHMADNEAELAELQKKIEAARDRAEKNERLAEKARAKADEETERGQKALRNAERYEQRAQDAREELVRLEGRTEAAQRALDDLTASVAKKRAELATVEAEVKKQTGQQAELAHTNEELKAFGEFVRSTTRQEQDVLNKQRREISDAKDELAAITDEIEEARAQRDEVQADLMFQNNLTAAIAKNLDKMAKLDPDERVEQMTANLDGIRWAVQHVLEKLGIADQKKDLGYETPEGDPPPILQLVFDLAKQRTAQLLNTLTRARGGPGGPPM